MMKVLTKAMKDSGESESNESENEESQNENEKKTLQQPVLLLLLKGNSVD